MVIYKSKEQFFMQNLDYQRGHLLIKNFDCMDGKTKLSLKSLKSEYVEDFEMTLHMNLSKELSSLVEINAT